MANMHPTVEDTIKDMDNEIAREWYAKYSELDEGKRLGYVFDRAFDRNFVFDPSSGMFFRGVLSDEALGKVGRTVIDVAVPRPVDLHYHEDVAEVITVLDGACGFYIEKPDGTVKRSGKNLDFVQLNPKGRNEIIVDKNVAHTFRPGGYNGYLEIRVTCDGILDLEKEVCVTPFNEFWKLEDGSVVL